MTATFSAADFAIDNGTGGTGGFFKPKEHPNAVAILFEPTGHRPGIATQFGPKDYTDGDFTIFATQSELDQGTPSIVLEGATTEGNVGKSLASYVGRRTVGKLGQKPTTKGNPAWIIEPIEPAQQAKVIDYLVARENKKAAVASAPAPQANGLPSFLQG